jgi:hypothetical protein
MDDYEDIETAALHHDWQSCARIMFGLLYRFPAREQRNIAAAALTNYIDIWKAKHSGALRSVPDHILRAEKSDTTPQLPDFPEDLDPADAEFENALIEFYNAAFFDDTHDQSTLDFATAIRSAVIAKQVNKWINAHPNDYAKWKAGLRFDGPTFLVDETAAREAEATWKFVAGQLKNHRLPASPVAISTRAVFPNELYARWKQSDL